MSTARVAYTLPEVAAMTGLSLRALADGCRAGRFRASKPGRTWLMTPAHIEYLLAATERGTSADPDPQAARVAAARQRVAERLARKGAA